LQNPPLGFMPITEPPMSSLRSLVLHTVVLVSAFFGTHTVCTVLRESIDFLVPKRDVR
jgi:hypothetical protein